MANVDRRRFLQALSGVVAVSAKAEQKRGLPPVCLLSSALSQIDYPALGDIVQQLGFDGVELTVMAGGHVDPSQAPVDEVRAIESLRGSGLEVPIIRTALLSPADPWSRTVLALAGRTGVPLFRSGLNRRNVSPSTRRDAQGLQFVGLEYRIGLAIAVGGVGEYDVAEARTLSASLDAQWSGLCLNSACFASDSGISDAMLRETMPLVKAVSLADFQRHLKPDGSSSIEWRPLGQGTVDFGRCFALLARAGFSGPVSVERGYESKDVPGSLQRDAEFTRKQIQSAYGNVKS